MKWFCFYYSKRRDPLIPNVTRLILSWGMLIWAFLGIRGYSQIYPWFPDGVQDVPWGLSLGENDFSIIKIVVLGMLLAGVMAVGGFYVFLGFFKKFKKLEIENNIKSAFLENISLEIRSSINGIVGLTRLLNKTDISEDQKECMELLKYSSERALGLLNNVMDFSKIESGKVQIESISFDLYSNVREVIMQHVLDVKEKAWD